MMAHSEPFVLREEVGSLHVIDVLKSRAKRQRGTSSEIAAYERLHETLVRTPNALLQVLVETALALFGVETAGISLLDTTEEGRDVFRWCAIAGRYADALNTKLPRYTSPCGHVLGRNTPLLLRQPLADFPIFEGVEPPIEEALLAPFYVDDRPVGTLWLVLHKPGEEFDYEDALQIIRLSHFAALGYQILRDARHATEREEQHRFLLALNDQMRSLDEPAAIQHAALCALGAQLGVHRVAYAEDQGDGATVVVQRNFTNGVQPVEGRHRYEDFGKSLLRALRLGQTIVSSDVLNEPALSAAEKDAHGRIAVGACIHTPVLRQRRLLGVLSVHSRWPRRWTRDEVELVRTLSERMWDAIQRAGVEDALKRADRQKDEFLAMLAHELRNPLASITNAGALLRLTVADVAAAERPLRILERQTRQLTRLVDDLLDISRLATGRITFEEAPQAVRSIVEQAIEAVLPTILGKSHRLSLSTADAQLFVKGDHVRLVQALSNILHNAAKYTDPHGEIYLGVRGSATEVVMEVRDTGAGISAELLPRVFDLFVQSDRTLDQAQGGLGIGLSVVKRLIERQGGCVEAFSAGLGKGSTFTIRLPRIEPPGWPGEDAPSKTAAGVHAHSCS